MIRRPRTVVATGASVGVGRAVALTFAACGGRDALLGQGSAGLAAADETRHAGGEALIVAVDVADPKAIDRAAQHVMDAFGRIDVRVNNAFAGVFAPFTEVTPDEYRRVTEAIHLGCVFGTRAALGHMLPSNRGTVVQVGAALADRGIPLRSVTHAILGFNESLRRELLREGTRARTTMVLLLAVNTSQFDWMLSRGPGRARPVATIHEPELVVRAMAHAAAHPRWREYWVGGSTAATLVANALVPGWLARYLARTGYDSHLEEGAQAGTGCLRSPADGPRGRGFGAHGRFEAGSRPGSAQEWVSRNRARAGKTALIICGAAVFVRKVTRSPGGSHLGPSRGVWPLRAGGRGNPV
ncbi:SDR family oxidoreductase [Streptomyces sp. NPDC057681]|uniref:SDR family oxidoreductase n=1 Tax=Streptomyces sp. NPDC057681 TaxID=3346209 RepID=UPI00367FEAF5